MIEIDRDDLEVQKDNAHGYCHQQMDLAKFQSLLNNVTLESNNSAISMLCNPIGDRSQVNTLKGPELACQFNSTQGMKTNFANPAAQSSTIEEYRSLQQQSLSLARTESFLNKLDPESSVEISSEDSDGGPEENLEEHPYENIEKIYDRNLFEASNVFKDQFPNCCQVPSNSKGKNKTDFETYYQRRVSDIQMKKAKWLQKQQEEKMKQELSSVQAPALNKYKGNTKHSFFQRMDQFKNKKEKKLMEQRKEMEIQKELEEKELTFKPTLISKTSYQSQTDKSEPSFLRVHKSKPPFKQPLDERSERVGKDAQDTRQLDSQEANRKQVLSKTKANIKEENSNNVILSSKSSKKTAAMPTKIEICSIRPAQKTGLLRNGPEIKEDSRFTSMKTLNESALANSKSRAFSFNNQQLTGDLLNSPAIGHEGNNLSHRLVKGKASRIDNKSARKMRKNSWDGEGDRDKKEKVQENSERRAKDRSVPKSMYSSLSNRTSWNETAHSTDRKNHKKSFDNSETKSKNFLGDAKAYSTFDHRQPQNVVASPMLNKTFENKNGIIDVSFQDCFPESEELVNNSQENIVSKLWNNDHPPNNSQIDQPSNILSSSHRQEKIKANLFAKKDTNNSKSFILHNKEYINSKDENHAHTKDPIAKASNVGTLYPHIKQKSEANYVPLHSGTSNNQEVSSSMEEISQMDRTDLQQRSRSINAINASKISNQKSRVDATSPAPKKTGKTSNIPQAHGQDKRPELKEKNQATVTTTPGKTVHSSPISRKETNPQNLKEKHTSAKTLDKSPASQKKGKENLLSSDRKPSLQENSNKKENRNTGGDSSPSVRRDNSQKERTNETLNSEVGQQTKQTPSDHDRVQSRSELVGILLKYIPKQLVIKDKQKLDAHTSNIY